MQMLSSHNHQFYISMRCQNYNNIFPLPINTPEKMHRSAILYNKYTQLIFKPRFILYVVAKDWQNFE
ncbi:hypothetical protein GKR41_00786 [Candidatus Vallotia lariciata]|nr:hypothetical protein GKR41_00786 [Candidatus Vallotia lariciata]